MNGVERDTRFLQELGRYADMNPAELARAVGVSKTTIWRPATGKATSRLSQPVLDKLRSRFPQFYGWDEYLAAEGKGSEALEAAYSSEQIGWLELLCKLDEQDREMILQLARHFSRQGQGKPPPTVHDDKAVDFWDRKLERERGQTGGDRGLRGRSEHNG